MSEPPTNHSDSNPYAAPEEFLANDTILGEGELERIRENSIDHEKSIRELAKFYSAMVWIFLLAGVLLLVKFTEGRGSALPFAMICGALTAPCYFVAHGLGKLQNWARITAGILAIPGLLLFPFVTPIAAYFLYLLFSERGAFVCSEEYGSVIKATPHIQGRNLVLVTVLYYLLYGVFVGGIILQFWFNVQGAQMRGKP